MLDDGVGVTVAPGLPDACERLAGNPQRVDDDEIHLDLAQSQVGEMGEHLAADVEVAADGGPVAVGNALPEPVRVQPGGVAPEHAVVLGDQVQAAAGLEHADHLLDRASRVGQRLQHVPADRQIELRILQREVHRIIALEADAVAERRVLGARPVQVGFLDVHAGEAGLREEAREPGDDLSGSAADVHNGPRGRMALEDRFLLRPDGLDLRGQVADHRLVRHLLRLRAVGVHGAKLNVTSPRAIGRFWSLLLPRP